MNANVETPEMRIEQINFDLPKSIRQILTYKSRYIYKPDLFHLKELDYFQYENNKISGYVY